MRRIAVLLGMAVVAVLAGPAQASVRLVYSDGRPAPTLQRWATEAQVPTVALTLVVHGADCPDYPGLGASCASGHELWLAPGVERNTLWHELGHLYAEWKLDAAARDRFGALVGDRRPWEDRSLRTTHGWIDSPAERFADAYMLCAMGRKWSAARWLRRPARDQIHDYGYRPSPRQHRQVCALIGSPPYQR